MTIERPRVDASRSTASVPTGATVAYLSDQTPDPPDLPSADSAHGSTEATDVGRQLDVLLAQRIGTPFQGGLGGPGVGAGPATGRPSLRGLGGLAGIGGRAGLATAGTSRIRLIASQPNVIGDFFGGGSSTVDVIFNNSFHTFGQIVSGSPGSSSAVIAFERDGVGSFNDFTTVGPGTDASGDTFADTFNITEPLPPNDVPTSPGTAYQYDGGTAVYTNSPAATTAQDGIFQDGQLWFATYSYSGTFELPPTAGISIRRIKIAENNSPVPRDRYYFDYKFFRDVKGAFGDVNRYTFGIEKTFFQGQSSIDTRLPFGGTLEADQFDDELNLRGVQFGNITVIFKQIIRESETFLAAGGVGVAVPTGSDSRLFRTDGTQLLLVENNSVRLLPYFGGLWTPNERFYAQGFLQVDVDLNGNPVRGNINGGALPKIGVLQDTTLLFADLSGGYWLFRRGAGVRRGLRGLATIGELHFNTTTQDADIVAAPGLAIASRTRRFDVLNLTLGLHAELGEALTLTSGMSFPLRNRDDRQFDVELGVLANLFF